MSQCCHTTPARPADSRPHGWFRNVIECGSIYDVADVCEWVGGEGGRTGRREMMKMEMCEAASVESRRANSSDGLAASLSTHLTGDGSSLFSFVGIFL